MAIIINEKKIHINRGMSRSNELLRSSLGEKIDYPSQSSNYACTTIRIPRNYFA